MEELEAGWLAKELEDRDGHKDRWSEGMKAAFESLLEETEHSKSAADCNNYPREVLES